MAKDKQKELVKRDIESGHIKTLKEVFEYYPISPVITYLKTNHKTLTEHLEQPDRFRIGTLAAIASYFEVDELSILKLVVNQRATKKGKRTK